MSHIADIILTTSQADTGAGCIDEINAWLKERRHDHLSMLDADNHPRWPETAWAYAAVLDGIDITAFVEFVLSRDWAAPRSVQIFVKRDGDDVFTVYGAPTTFSTGYVNQPGCERPQGLTIRPETFIDFNTDGDRLAPDAEITAFGKPLRRAELGAIPYDHKSIADCAARGEDEAAREMPKLRPIVFGSRESAPVISVPVDWYAERDCIGHNWRESALFSVCSNCGQRRPRGEHRPSPET